MPICCLGMGYLLSKPRIGIVILLRFSLHSTQSPQAAGKTDGRARSIIVIYCMLIQVETPLYRITLAPYMLRKII